MADLTYTLFEAAAAAIDEDTHVCGPVQITDHVARGLARLLEQFQGQPRVEALLTAFLTQVQEAEDTLWDLRGDRSLDDAEGVQLDAIGTIVGQLRGGLSDTNYRALLRARIQANRSDGQADRLLLIARLALTGAATPAVLVLTEDFPGALRVQDTEDISPIDPEVINDLLQDAKAAGVRLQFLYTIFDSDLTFTYAPAGSLVTSSLQGYDDGHYAGVLD